MLHKIKIIKFKKNTLIYYKINQILKKMKQMMLNQKKNINNKRMNFYKNKKIKVKMTILDQD